MSTFHELNVKAHDLRGAIESLPSGIESGRTSRSVKFFTPDGAATWYIVDKCDGEVVFGYCDPGLGLPELGYVSMTELETLRGHLGLRVEVDLYWKGTLAAAYEAQGQAVPDWLPDEPAEMER